MLGNACLAAQGIGTHLIAGNAVFPRPCIERFIQTLQQEVRDDYVVFGEQHRDHFISESIQHDHELRPRHDGQSIARGRRPRSETRTT